ncbi:MAG: ABC transporter permease [Planctomycetes bacterium]|nr:ABC transporter permease [Planctomycetota bacterium]
MFSYIIRKSLYAIPILIGVNVITFLLFFVVNPPDIMARRMLGEKNVTPEAIQKWKSDNGYNLPSFVNTKEAGWAVVTNTIFFQKSMRLFWFDFGRSDRTKVDIGSEIKQRMGPSFLLALPTFIFGIMVEIVMAMLIAYYRGSYLDFWTVLICVIMMSVSMLFYIIGAQYFFGKVLKLFPISGYDTGIYSLKFIMLPVIIGIIGGVGVGIRFYRTLFLEEVSKDYVRTARAKGLSERSVLFRHVLKNAMIPILTDVMMTLPFLFVGSLLMESFFAIPGLGSFTIDAINAQDFAIVRSMVFLGAVLYIIGQLLTDISYTIADPRIRLS